MQIISFINMKGGVGKTTIAVNVAYGLATMHKQNVLFVDSDPQFNATQYLLDDETYLAHIKDDSKGTLLDIFSPLSPGRIRTTHGSSHATDRTKMALSQCICNVFNGGPGHGKLDLIPCNS